MVEPILRGLFAPACASGLLELNEVILGSVLGQSWASPASARLGLGRNAWPLLLSLSANHCHRLRNSVLGSGAPSGRSGLTHSEYFMDPKLLQVTVALCLYIARSK